MTDYGKVVNCSEDMASWPDHVPCKTSTYSDAMAKAYVQVALAQVGAMHDQPDVRIQAKPAKAVFVNHAFAVGKLVLVPETVRITIAENDGKPLPIGALLCTVPEDICDKRVCLVPMFSDTFVVPAWAVRPTGEQAKVNMEVNIKVVNVSCNTINRSASSVAIGVPVLINSKKINAKDEVLLYRPAAAKAQPKRCLSMPLTTQAKAAKHK